MSCRWLRINHCRFRISLKYRKIDLENANFWPRSGPSGAERPERNSLSLTCNEEGRGLEFELEGYVRVTGGYGYHEMAKRDWENANFWPRAAALKERNGRNVTS